MGKRFMRQGDNWVRMAAMKMLWLVAGGWWLVRHFETL
jgi:hypothetical protein